MIVLMEIIMVLFSVFIAMDLGFSYPELPTNPHTPMNAEELCLDCHDSYRDEVDEHEFIVEVTDACERCHNLMRLERSHPYDVDPDDPSNTLVEVEVPDHLPLQDGMLTCGTCHDPHLSYLSQVKSFKKQKPKVSVDVEYYQTFYTRMSDPVEGFDPLCNSCHHLL